MMTPIELNEYLCCLRANNVMSCSVKFDGLELAATFAPEFDKVTADPPRAPGGWKSEVSDPEDPDPLQIGNLDAPIAFDDPEVAQ